MNAISAETGGPIGYMVRNGVAANLLMALIAAMGLLGLTGVAQEAFPVLPLDAVEVLVAYPGAAPDDVEQSIVLAIEEAVGGLGSVRDVTAVAAEGAASVIVKLKAGTDARNAVSDIEAAVNGIRGFPARAERPDVREMTSRQSVIRLILYGDVSERALKELAYRAEDEIAKLPAVSSVETTGARPYEILIEPPLDRLRALGLTVEDVAAAVRRNSLDLAAGSIDTRDSAVRVRTLGRKVSRQDFEEIVLLSAADATMVRVGDIARVRDGFRDVGALARHNGLPAVFVEVQRSAEEQVLDIAAAVESYVEERLAPSLPAGVAVTVWNNEAEIFEDRFRILRENGLLGLLLVLLVLTLFLEVRTAAWTAVGIVVSFAGAVAAAWLLDVSLNTNSLLGFILVVGMLVDDAVVVAEHVHAERSSGLSSMEAAIRGTRRITRPLVFTVLTTVVAFVPLLFVPGPAGKLMNHVATILIAALVVSLIDSLFVLPGHLARIPPATAPGNPVARVLSAVRGGTERQLARFVEGPLDRALRLSTEHPALVIAGGIAAIVLAAALVAAGLVDVVFLPPVDSDIVMAALEMPEGTPARATDEAARQVEASGRRALDRLEADRGLAAGTLFGGVLRTIGVPRRQFGGGATVDAGVRPPPHLAAVEFKLSESGRLDAGASVFVEAWREEAADLTGIESLVISAALIDLGAPVSIDLSHPDPDRLGLLAEALKDGLQALDGVHAVRSNRAAGVREIQIEPRPEARALGLTLDDLARQLRSAFFGAEALRVWRGGEEVRVRVRLPAEERDSVGDVESYMVRLPGGDAVPLGRVAEASLARAPSSIFRGDGQRIVTVTADVDTSAASVGEIHDVLAGEVLPDLTAADPELTWTFGGQRREQLQTFQNLLAGLLLALVAIYALLAVPLRSYARPLLIMAVIPFGIVGAILGHWIVGISLSAQSMLGILGVSGVVVNDSVMMVDFIDNRLRRGVAPAQAIVDGAKARFRPIFLTSLTTFLGFAPLIFERSPQARLVVPPAVSMGFGLAFATTVLMLFLPALAAVAFGAARSDEAARGPGHGRRRLGRGL